MRGRVRLMCSHCVRDVYGKHGWQTAATMETNAHARNQ